MYLHCVLRQCLHLLYMGCVYDLCIYILYRKNLLQSITGAGFLQDLRALGVHTSCGGSSERCQGSIGNNSQ